MTGARPHVSVVAIPDAAISTLGGVYDVLSWRPDAVSRSASAPELAPFRVEIVSECGGAVDLASSVSLKTHAAVAAVEHTDIVITPSLLVEGDLWRTGRYPSLVRWLRAMHDNGAILCSACSGVFLLAETGLFDGIETTVHWSYADKLRKTFPSLRVSPEKALIVAGDRGQLITSGASTSWHDLVLYLTAREIDPATAQAVAHFYALQWHQEGLAPFFVFQPAREHGDAAILGVQDWLDDHYPAANPVEEMIARSGLPERTFKRRFTHATGHSPIAYVQQLRVDKAKRRLERTTAAIDDVSAQVGYEDPAFFRRLFKRAVGMTPGAYRRKFKLPNPGRTSRRSETPE